MNACYDFFGKLYILLVIKNDVLVFAKNDSKSVSKCGQLFQN